MSGRLVLQKELFVCDTADFAKTLAWRMRLERHVYNERCSGYYLEELDLKYIAREFGSVNRCIE